MGSHHLLVVRVKGLLDQGELLCTQLPVGVDKLGKLDTHTKVNKSDTIHKKCPGANCGYLQHRKQCRQRTDHYYCPLSWLLSAYRPWLVTQVIDRLQGVDAWHSSVLQTDDQVAKVFILGHTEGMLTNEGKVWLE